MNNETTNGKGSVARNEDFRVRQILGEAMEQMKAENISPAAMFMALLELVAMFVVCNGEKQATAMAIRGIKFYVREKSLHI